MKLQTLKPRLATLVTQRIPTQETERLRGRAAKGGTPDKRWTGRKLQEWRARILAAEPLCRACSAKGLTTVAREVDHLVPLEYGGTYDDENANPLCAACHKAKTAKDRGYRVRPTIGEDGWPS